MAKIRVAIFHNDITPSRIDLFNYLSKSDEINLTVFFLNQEVLKNKNYKQYINDIEFSYKILPALKIKTPIIMVKYLINFNIFKIFKKYKFDVVITTGWADFATQIIPFMKKYFGFKLIIWSGSTHNEPSLIRILSKQFVKKLLRKGDLHFVYGENSKKYISSLGVSKHKIKVVLNTVKNSRFSKPLAKAKKIRNRIRKFYKDNIFIILYVGQLINRKGIDLLIHSVSKIKNKRILTIVVGSGEKRDILTQLAKKLNQKVLFIDHMNYYDLPYIYQASDLFVLPSREEVWGLVLNEATAAGMPVIVSSKVGSIDDLMSPKLNGLCFKSGSVNDLAKKITFLIDNRKIANIMKKNSIFNIRDKDVSNTGNTMLESIKSLFS